MTATSVRAMVRVPHGELSYAQRLLDNGAQAIVYPGVDTAEQASAFARALRAAVEDDPRVTDIPSTKGAL